MKTKLFKSTISVLLVLLLCVSVMAPAFSAAEAEVAAAASDGDVLEKHAENTTIAKSDLQTIFGDSTSIVNTAYYGFAPVPEADTELDTSTITYVSNSAGITAGNWLALKTTAYTGSFLNRKPNWDDATKRSQLTFSVRTYYTATFTVNGSSDGALYLNDEAVSGNVNLFTDTEYTVTAADVEGFTREVNGVTLGEAFTPNADMTITADYTADASAAISLTVGEGGTAKIISDGTEVTTDTIPAGKLFTVEATPNTNRGYKTESIIVTKNGEAIESGDGIYGPVADGEVYAVTVSFKYDPDHVEKEVIGTDAKVSRTDLSNFLGGYSYYGIAPANNPDDITQLIAVVRPNYDVTAGEYIIYGTNDNTGGLLPSPIWTNAKLMVLDVRVYYNGTFTVTGNDEGEVYLNGESVTGTQKLYTDTEYTVTAKNIDEYGYTMEGAEDGTAFTPTANIDVTVIYTKLAYATVSLTVSEGGTAAVYSNGNVVTDRVSEGETFTVEATPNELKGYELDSIVVKKDGVEVEAVDGAYGPVADQEAYEITVNFRFDPPTVNKEVDANESDISRSDVSGLFNGAYSYYGIAPESDPDNITYLAVALTSDYDVVDGGKYYIYGSNDGNLLNPRWTNAKLMLMTVRTYYTVTFTVSGHDEGEVYLNGESVTGSKKLYTDTEYTVTAKNIEEYGYVMEGAEDGTAFTPTSNINVTVTYTKLAYATFTLNANEGGTAEVQVNGETVTDRVSEGDSFTVEATPNENKGYKLDSIVVTKDGVEVEAVDGAYGPVADGEEYEITVTFKFDPDEVDYEKHAGEKLYYTDFGSIFNTAVGSFGWANIDTPYEIHTVGLTGSAELTPGEYYIYKAAAFSSDWNTVRKLNLSAYYNATFTVTGHEDGEVYLNGESVTGTKKLYTDETYTITVKNDIDEYICTLYGAEEGVAFTPTEDLEVTAAYIKEAYATFTVNSNEGGTVKVMTDGEEAIEMIPEGNTFAIVVTPNVNNDYYVESIVVIKDGEEIESEDSIYGPVLDDEEYEITVTFAKATLTLDDCDVSLKDIYFKNYDAIEQAILQSATLDPAAFAEGAQTEVEYAAYNILGYDVYEPLNYNNDLSHPFGTSERGGTLKGGNTEKVRVTYTLPELGIELRATATVTVNDDRITTRIDADSDSVTITYGDNLKAAILNIISVYNVDEDEPLAYTDDEITITPDSLNANLLSAYRPQEVTVRYNGTEIYAAAEATINVYVQRAQSSLDTKSETITYGDTPAAEVITTPEDLDYIKVIAGIDGDAQGFVSIDIPESVKEKMQIKVGSVVLFDIYEYLSNRIGEGTTIDGLKNLVVDIYNRINSNELIRQAIENSGFNMEILDTIVGYIEDLPEMDTNLKIRLGQVPTKAGAYLMFAVSTDTNYTTSADASYIIIKPQSTDEDTTIELRFRAQMEGEEGLQYLSYEAAQEFNFGGDFYIDDVLTETEKLHTLYVGTTYAGDVIAQEEPVTVPGIYTETVYILGGNYWADPITRAYTINRIETPMAMDDLTVTYDGEAHAVKAYMEDGSDLPEGVTYTYVGIGYLSSEAPVNAGDYLVYAYYEGTDIVASASATAKLSIEKKAATITVTCTEEVTYGDINIFNAAEVANIQYTVDGTVNDDVLGLIIPTLHGDGVLTVGEYTATVTFIQTNPNYDVTIEKATLTIVPREVTITVDDIQKEYGDEDPELTYQVDNMAPFEIAKVTISREEGEEIGEYAITAEVEANPNYSFTVENGTFTITAKSIVVSIDDETKQFNQPDPRKYTYTVTNSKGNVIEDTSDIGIVIARDVGEEIGEYEIYVRKINNTHYILDTELSTNGILTITPIENALKMDDLTVAYDGATHPLEAYLADGEELIGNVTYTYIGYNYERENAPVNAGKYTVTASYEGDEIHAPVTVTAMLTITKLEATVTVTCKDEVVYGDIDSDNAITAADIHYTVSGTINDDILGIFTCELVADENFPNVGEYTATVILDQTNHNYDVTIENATLKIVPRSVIISVNDSEKWVGDDDPAFTCSAVDAEGDPIVVNTLGLTFTREEGEEPGEYAIYVPEIGNANYVLNADASTEGKLTVKKPESYILGDVDGDGNVTSIDATFIQRYLANTSVDAIDFDYLAADVDGDGNVTSMDATFIQRYLAVMKRAYPIGEPIYVKD